MSRFLLIGLDGAEPSLLVPWMDAGYLPNLAALRARGKFVPCHSTRPPVTFPAWTTCVTGVNPGRHGIFDFTEVLRGRYGIQFLNSSFRRAPALWNILSAAGKRCCVLGVPGTYPPEEINGVMVSGFDSPVATAVDESFVAPRDRYDDVKNWRFADFQESDIGPGWHAEALKRLLAKIGDKERIAENLLREEPWDFFMVVFGESDTVSHHFWLFHDPKSPRHRPGFETVIREVYARLDVAVGKLVAAAGEDVVVGIVSDHGFGGAGTGVVHLNNWLAEQGYLRFGSGGESWLKKIALRVVPARLRGGLFRRFKKLATRAEGKSRLGGIDWNNTRAWSEELNYFPNIHLNVEGREACGQVAQADYDRTVAELCEKLNAWEHIAHAWPRAELFTGDEVARAPDIIVELAQENGYLPSCLRSRGGPSFRRIQPGEYLGGKEKGMTGTHRDPGVLMLSVPFAKDEAHLQDVAPTVFATLGVAAPPMDGTSLFRNPSNPSNPSDHSLPERLGYTAGEEALIETRLRDLGYFE